MACTAGYGKRTGIRGKDTFRTNESFYAFEDIAFDFQVFDDGLDDESAGTELGNGGAKVQFCKCAISLGLRHFSIRNQHGKSALQRIPGPVDIGRLGIE